MEGNENGEQEEENVLDKPLNMPIQELEANWDITKVEEVEKKTFKDRYPKILKTNFKEFFRYQNPIRKEDPIHKTSKNPEIYSVALGDEKDIIASGYSNGEIHIFNKYYNLKVIQNSLDTILSLKLNPKNNQILLSVSSMGDVVHTHIDSAKKLSEFRIEKYIIKCMDFSSLNSKVAIGFAEGCINIYDDETQTLENVIKKGTSFATGHINQIHSVVFDKNNRTKLISGGRDKRLMLWDLRNLECSAMVVEPYILGDTLDIKGNYIIAGSYETSQGILLYDQRNLNKSIKNFRSDSKIYVCKFSKNENSEIFAAGGYKRNSVKLYDINKSDYLSGIEGNYSPCYALDFSTNGSVFAYGCADGGLRVVNI